MLLQQELYRLCLSADGPRTLDLDIPMSQLKALLAIASLSADRSPGPTAGDLAQLLGVTPSTVSTVTDRLMARGLVKQHDDPRDRRQRRCVLTESGHDLIRRFHRETQVRSTALLSILCDEDLDLVLRGTEALLRAARELDRSPAPLTEDGASSSNGLATAAVGERETTRWD